HALMALLDEEPPGSRFELFLDQPEVPLRESKAFAAVGRMRIRVRKENLGRGLLDQRPTDRTSQDVACALRREGHDAIELAPGLRAVLCEVLEGRIREEPPELVHPAH